MRCSKCQCYLPDEIFKTCPQCKSLTTTEPASAPITIPTPMPQLKPFADYFTFILEIGFESKKLSPSSLSFGSEGLAFVYEDGKKWDKINYTDLNSISRDGKTIFFLFHEKRSYHVSLKTERQAKLLHELLEKVKMGLSPIEISMYEKKLQNKFF